MKTIKPDAVKGETLIIDRLPIMNLSAEEFIHVNHALRTLDKEIPQKVEIETGVFDIKYPYCPRCNSLIEGWEWVKYCPHCGQRLDWENDDE